ncbi:hypothetical protein SOVF_055340 [Spinacia oleracea]|nr:hypothetical protein SOVF_055340 [Spinacia oleracea]
MEHLMERLDVAMFNAILRGSEEELPTDPMSDPISELKVLPIPAGKSSFGAGAQLKNAVGSWSNWLSDFFGLEEDDDPSKDRDETNEEEDAVKAFRLLNALGDLMRLALGMLADSTIRKEDSHETSNGCIISFPCVAKPVVYSPLPAALFSSLLGDSGQKRNGSSLLRKGHNSDDELEKLSVPLASINVRNVCLETASSKPNCMPKGIGSGREVVRYKLLQEAWRNGT